MATSEPFSGDPEPLRFAMSGRIETWDPVEPPLVGTPGDLGARPRNHGHHGRASADAERPLRGDVHRAAPAAVASGLTAPGSRLATVGDSGGGVMPR